MEPAQLGCPPRPEIPVSSPGGLFDCLFVCFLLFCLLATPSSLLSLSLSLPHFLTGPASVWQCSRWTLPDVSASSCTLPCIYNKLSSPPYLGAVTPFLLIFHFHSTKSYENSPEQPGEPYPTHVNGGVLYVTIALNTRLTSCTTQPASAR